MTARGTFEVKMTPQPPDDGAGGGFDRLFGDKQFHGELDAVSKSQMLAARTAVEGSAGYVALELVTGKLNGKRGSLTTSQGNDEQGRLYDGRYRGSGFRRMSCRNRRYDHHIEGGKHSYNFQYTLGKVNLILVRFRNSSKQIRKV
jgi:hypothetical protein